MCYLYPQVECNTKLDPTKTTLLKVQGPPPPPVPCPHSDYNSLDGNALADKIPVAQHVSGDILTMGKAE